MARHPLLREEEAGAVAGRATAPVGRDIVPLRGASMLEAGCVRWEIEMAWGACLSVVRIDFRLDRVELNPFTCLIETCHIETNTVLIRQSQQTFILFFMPRKLDEQALEIERLCEQAGLSPEAMAERVALQPDSMRKIIKGYQAASPQLMQSFRNVVEMESLRLTLTREFERLWRKSGWSREKAERELGLKAGEMERILSGQQRPDPIMIRIFKLRTGDTSAMPETAADELRDKAEPFESWAIELVQELRQLEEGDRRKALAAFKSLVALIPKKAARR